MTMTMSNPVKPSMLNKIFPVLRILVGALFVVSGFSKLMQPAQNFLAVIKTYEIIDGLAAQLLAQWMPWFEFILGILLILGVWTRVTLVGLWLMNSLFIVALGLGLFRQSPIGQCGCFGEKFTVAPKFMLMIDILLWGVFLVSFKFLKYTKSWSLDKKIQ